MHGFEAASGNGYNHFEPAEVAASLRMGDFLIGYESAAALERSGGTPPEEADSPEEAGDYGMLALTADRRGSLVEELTAFFGGTSGLYWALYRSIWPYYDRRLQDAALGLLGLEMVAYGDIEEGFRFVQHGRSEAAEA